MILITNDHPRTDIGIAALFVISVPLVIVGLLTDPLWTVPVLVIPQAFALLMYGLYRARAEKNGQSKRVTRYMNASDLATLKKTRYISAARSTRGLGMMIADGPFKNGVWVVPFPHDGWPQWLSWLSPGASRKADKSGRGVVHGYGHWVEFDRLDTDRIYGLHGIKALLGSWLTEQYIAGDVDLEDRNPRFSDDIDLERFDVQKPEIYVLTCRKCGIASGRLDYYGAAWYSDAHRHIGGGV